MDEDFIERAVKIISPAVLEERIHGLDRRVGNVEEDMRNLATKQDVRDLKKVVETKDARSNDWLKTIVGGAVSGIIVGIVLAWVLPAIAATPHH